MRTGEQFQKNILKTIADNSTFSSKAMNGSDFRFPKLYMFNN